MTASTVPGLATVRIPIGDIPDDEEWAWADAAAPSSYRRRPCDDAGRRGVFAADRRRGCDHPTESSDALRSDLATTTTVDPVCPDRSGSTCSPLPVIATSSCR